MTTPPTPPGQGAGLQETGGRASALDKGSKEHLGGGPGDKGREEAFHSKLNRAIWMGHSDGEGGGIALSWREEEFCASGLETSVLLFF